MTIAMIVCQSPYVLVAADRMLSGRMIRDGELVEFRAETHPKVYLHPRHSVIWATAGPATVPYQGNQTAVDELIRDALADLRQPINERIVPALEFLDPLVREELATVPQDMSTALDIFIGLHQDGQAGAVDLRFTKDGPWVESTLGHIAVSRHTRWFIKSLSPSALWPPPNSSVKAIASHMRLVMTQAINSAEQMAGDAADVGGGIDIAVCGPKGAAMLPAPN